MARPVKYKNDEEWAKAAKLSSDVILEIKEKSGLTYPALSALLGEHRIIISDSMLRQYACARKPIGQRRLSELAEIAYLEGLAGDRCMEVLVFHHFEHSNSLKSIQKDFEQYKRLLEKRLFQCIKELVEVGATTDQVRILVETGLKNVASELD